MDVKPGDKWIGLYNLTTPGEDGVFTTVSQNVATGENTTLSCPRQGRNFNWCVQSQTKDYLSTIQTTKRLSLRSSHSNEYLRMLALNRADVTLEVYGIDTCSEFAEGPMTFSDVKLW